ncbi:hypothetical protein JKF63_05889 [Porcisia hertigi]|uniref:Uncharacterized protein n=1 Tax=Porcisia hertigi TaxID=2761500 RepID=A0A836I831_9TRYP|nr:hypothetical protein JKF63_05889 [Porcisia hertigi]
MSAVPSSHQEYRQAIIELYEKHDPGKVSRVDETLKRFVGREEALVRTLRRKFYEGMPSGGEEAPDQASASSIAPPLHFSLPRMSNGSDTQPLLPPSSDATLSSAAEDYRTRAINLYRRYNPSKLDRVDAQLRKYTGQEEAYLRALERKLTKTHPAAAVADSTEEASLPATAIAAEAGPLDDNQGRTNDGSGSEENKAQLLSIHEAHAPERVNPAEVQPQSYLGGGEEVIEEGVVRYSPGPVASVADTLTTIPGATTEAMVRTATTVIHSADDPLRTVTSSAPLTVVATPQEDEKTAALSARLMAAASSSPQAENSVHARKEGGVVQCEGSEASVSPAALPETVGATVAARAPTHEASGLAAPAAASSPDSTLEAAFSLSPVCSSSGGSRAAVLMCAESVSVPGVTRSSPTPAPAAGPLQASSASKARLRARPSVPSKAAYPAREREVTCSRLVDTDRIGATLHSVIKRMALFDITFYDFFRVLGSFHSRGYERVSLEVANALLGVLFPGLSLAEVSWQRVHPSRSPEEKGEEAGLPAVEMRERIMQGAVRQLQSNVSVSNVLVENYAQSLVQRMAEFVKTCRMTLVQLQRQPRLLSAGFWVHRSVMPRAVPCWKRCWATTSTGGDALSLCHVGSLRTALCIPFASVARCYRERTATGAPPAYTRNGLAFQMTTGAPPLLVVLCPESGDVAAQLFSAFRSWCSSVRDAHLGGPAMHSASSLSSASRSQSVAPERGDQLAVKQVRVWVFLKTTSTYELQNWCVDGQSIHMLSGRTGELRACAVADLKSVITEMELPVRPPMREAHGFVFCFSNGLAPLMAFTEAPQERTWLLDRIYRSQMLMQVTVKNEQKRG